MQKDFSDIEWDLLVFCLLHLFSLHLLTMKLLVLLQEDFFPVVPLLMDEIEVGQLSFIVSFNSVCNEAGRNMLGIQGAEVFISALWCLVGNTTGKLKAI